MGRSLGTRQNYYFNEHKRFPYEYFVIPLLLIAAAYGVYRLYQMFQASRTPKTAMMSILPAIQKQDVTTLERWTTLNQDESNSLQLHNTPEEIIGRAFDAANQMQMKIKAYAIERIKTSGPDATVTVRFQYTTKYVQQPQHLKRDIPLHWEKNQWWISTDTLRTLVPKNQY